jgi:mRNA-degrading endonuclease RelE of RelBE toxin-antitoxin system
MIILYSKASLKYLSKLEKDHKSRIVTAVDGLPGKGNIKKMRGLSIKNLYRLRVGKFRVLFIWEHESIKVLDIDIRGDIYK